jgi:hypothetical protein
LKNWRIILSWKQVSTGFGIGARIRVKDNSEGNSFIGKTGTIIKGYIDDSQVWNNIPLWYVKFDAFGTSSLVRETALELID